jgi:hypothetical protein
MVMRYESLIERPREQLGRAVAFAGLSAGGGSLGFVDDPPGSAAAVELAPGHTIAGNPMRFATGRVELRSDEAWRTELPAPAARTVTALTRPLLRRYGYGARP